MGNLTSEQVAKLLAPLDSARVKGRSQGGRSVSYLEGYDIINTANEIFGFDGWTTDIVNGPTLTQIGIDGGFVCHANVKVSIMLDDSTWSHRTEVGCCTPATAKGTLPSADAVDTAMKGAVTDALKRALRLFGNQFGNSLYDKDAAVHTANNIGKTTPVTKPSVPAPAGVAATQLCQNCGGTMQFKSGVKDGKPWSAWFCDDSKLNGCSPIWNK